jgi:hypothetical protein
MKIQSSQFYVEKTDVDKYVKKQIVRCNSKIWKKRQVEHYSECASLLRPIIKNESNMICMGTRNNHERDVFQKILVDKNIKTYSLDISPRSKANYIMNFNVLPKDWENKWDIVFSNAIDHAIDATKVFYEWLRVVKVSGFLMVGFGLGKGVDATDCNSFDRKNLDEFMKTKNDLFELVSSIDISYVY